MRTARSLIVSPYLVVSHAHPPPGATMHAPPATMHAPPGATMHTAGSNHTCPPRATTHTSPSKSNHACPPPRATMQAPPGANTHTPGATTHAPLSNHAHPPVDRIVDTRFWKYYLAPTSLRAVIKVDWFILQYRTFWMWWVFPPYDVFCDCQFGNTFRQNFFHWNLQKYT